MGLTTTVLGALTGFLKLNDQMSGLMSTVREQQGKIERLNERVIKLETTLDVLFKVGEIRAASYPGTTPKEIEK